MRNQPFLHQYDTISLSLRSLRSCLLCVASITTMSSLSSPTPSDDADAVRKQRILSSKLYFDIPPSKVAVIYSSSYDIAFFGIEKLSGGDGGGTPAKDALGNDIIAAEWLKTHGPGDRTLAQGLKGEQSFHLYGFIMCISATAARAFKSVLQSILLSAEGRVSVGLVGKEKIQDKLSRFDELKGASLSYLGVSSPGDPTEIGATIPSNIEACARGSPFPMLVVSEFGKNVSIEDEDEHKCMGDKMDVVYSMALSATVILSPKHMYFGGQETVAESAML